MKFALIQERKSPPDRRVVLSPTKLQEAQAQLPKAEFIVESSSVRVFPDSAYAKAGFEVKKDISDAEVMLGVKEVPIEALIPNKKYFFFSHTIKKQPYNRDLLQAILEKNIELYDHEVITRPNGQRLVAFGRYAGIVGAYNGIRAWGKRHGGFDLPKAETLNDRAHLIRELKKVQLPAIKILLTGKGRVGKGAKEMLDAMELPQISVEDYLNKTYDHPVYCQIDIASYNKRKDGVRGNKQDFFAHPEAYRSDFFRFARVTDLFIAGHFYGDGAPYLYTREDAKHPDFKISVVADISCDIDGPVATTIRPSTIADPLYGYDPQSEQEVPFDQEGAVTVMAVDNLPCELPKDASEGFGDMFVEHVLPAFFNGDKDGILERALMTKNGKLTDRYAYLQDFVEGKE
ncbi:NAD(P)-dependent oxidoreductase [Croceiramulus getboli]|nr:NAD(P)-dependent oxidoreductase [Flavobacteriaceae bacterium YJPT1-3]